MSLEDQIKRHKELSKTIEDLEEQKRALGLSIMQQMQSKTLQIPGFYIRRCSRLSIKLSLEEARTLNAVKFEEVVDKDKIKVFYNNGKPITGVTEIHYIQILENRTQTPERSFDS